MPEHKTYNDYMLAAQASFHETKKLLDEHQDLIQKWGDYNQNHTYKDAFWGYLACILLVVILFNLGMSAAEKIDSQFWMIWSFSWYIVGFAATIKLFLFGKKHNDKQDFYMKSRLLTQKVEEQNVTTSAIALQMVLVSLDKDKDKDNMQIDFDKWSLAHGIEQMTGILEQMAEMTGQTAGQTVDTGPGENPFGDEDEN